MTRLVMPFSIILLLISETNTLGQSFPKWLVSGEVRINNDYPIYKSPFLIKIGRRAVHQELYDLFILSGFDKNQQNLSWGIGYRLELLKNIPPYGFYVISDSFVKPFNNTNGPKWIGNFGIGFEFRKVNGLELKINFDEIPRTYWGVGYVRNFNVPKPKKYRNPRNQLKCPS